VPKQAIIELTVNPNVGSLERELNRVATKFGKDIQGAMAPMAGSRQGAGGGNRGGGGAPPGGTTPGGVNPNSFWGGWSKAGGPMAALGTISKYWLAYKAIDLPLKTLAAAKNLTLEGAQAWMQYEEAMANASRTMYQPGLNRGFLKEMMGKEALDFTTKYRASIDDVAQSMYELGSANFSAKDTIQAYQVPLKVNIALQGNITQTTRLMTQMLKIHGEQMGKNMSTEEKMTRLGGILLKTWQIEQVELSDLAGAYKYVAGSSTAMKIKAEELIPTLGFLSTYGLRGSIGGTGLNQFFLQSAKNIKITKDQMLELEKATRGSTHKVSLGIKADELTSPLQILISMAKAVQGMQGNLGGRMKAAGIFGDIFNIRGARPAQILADMDKLAVLMGNIGVAANTTTAEYRAFIEEIMQLRNNTPQAQLQIMQQNLYMLGVEVLTTASKTHNLVGALKEMNSFLTSLRP
jgi:TP901 family phage tail tape measure protein